MSKTVIKAFGGSGRGGVKEVEPLPPLSFENWIEIEIEIEKYENKRKERNSYKTYIVISSLRLGTFTMEIFMQFF